MISSGMLLAPSVPESDGNLRNQKQNATEIIPFLPIRWE